MDIDYLKNIKDLKSKIKSSYSCNQERCPKMRDRLNRHVKDHHSSLGQLNTLDSGTQGEKVTKDSVTCGTHDEQHTILVPSYFDARDEETTMSSTQSSKESVKETSQKFCVSCTNSVQRDFVTADLISSIYNLNKVENVSMIHHNNEVNRQTNFNNTTPASGKYDKYTESSTLNDLNVVVEKTKLHNNYNSHESIALEKEETLEAVSLKKDSKSINEHINEHIYSYDMNTGSDNEQSTAHKSKNILKDEIKNWLAKIELKSYHTKDINTPELIVDRFLNRLSKLLDKPNKSKMYKLTLEGEIVELLLDLPIHFECPKYKMIHINKLAEELANILLNILRQDGRCNAHETIQNIILQKAANKVLGFRPNEDDLKTKLIKIIKNTLITNDMQRNVEMEESIVENIMENINSIQFSDRNDLEDIIYSIICNYTNVTELQASELAKTMLMNIKSIAEKEVVNKKPSIMLIQPQLSGIISVYNTEEKLKMFTSTPKKKKKPDEEIPKLNPEQISYMEKLSTVVRDWVKSLPIHFDKTEDAILKDTVISDLAGNLMYAIRYDQIVVGLKKSDKRFVVKDKESTLKDIIFLWLNRYGIFDDRQKCTKEIEDLYSNVNKIPVPVLTRPQHGTRQTIAKTAWLEGENYYDDDEYIPKGIDILEDNISMWMNEQSDIFAYEVPSMRGRMVKALAGDIQERLVSKHTDKEIMDDIGCWLNEVVKPENKKDIPDLIEELKNRIKDIPQDITLGRRYIERIYEIYHKWLATQNPESNESVTFEEDFLDPNGTMKEYIAKFIQKNCDTDDLTVRKVFAYTLKKELLKLSPDARKDMYNISSQTRNNHVFSIEKFANELEYIKILSDWLNTLSIDPNYKVLRNKHRIEFIHNLAKYFVEIEDERAKFPNAMDYDAYLMSIITSNAVYLPLTNEQKIYMLQTASSLLKKLEDYRKKPKTFYRKQAINTEDLGHFIEEFVKEYGKDVVDDPLKLEVWMDRLTQEVQNIALETADPMLLEKTQIYNKLAQVAYPGEDSVALFGLQLEYATEVMDWLKNLPLKKNLNVSEEQLLVSMISDLSDRIIDRRIRKLDNTNNIQEDTEIVEFIENWISKLPLETYDDIVIPIVIQQLMNRIDRANKSQRPKTVNDTHGATEKSDQLIEKNVKTKSPDKSKTYKSDPENAIFEAVDKFCKSLPIQTKDKDVAKATKDEIAKKLLQKISKLNIDPIIFNDELLFKEMFRDEVDMVLENMPQIIDPQKNVEKLKNTLIDSVVEIESVIKEQSAGEDYKQKLENTIEASIPNPVQMSQIYDPGFEFYKNRLATMFILQNFDHADEDIKLKYEKRIQSEVDKYFEHVQNRNAIPLSKDRIRNELYSVLFKVPIPNEASIVGEVEEAKTRFEIDAWYESLPLTPTSNLDELLEREKILSTLAKRIHDLEKHEKDGDPIIHKEIMKWLLKLPIVPGYSKNITDFANQLQKRLKSTSKERKCVLKETHREKGKGKKREKRKSDKNLEGILKHDAKKQSASVEKLRFSPRPHTQIHVEPQKPAAELILEAVETWCSQLPLPTSDPREAANSRSIKDTLAINIVLKISELNSDPEVFANEYEYDIKLDQEIDKLTYNLPLLCDFQSKEAGKLKLKEMIRSIKPLIVLEREKHKYKEHLKNTVRSLLEEPHIVDQSRKVKPSKDDVDKIVDNFIEYNCSKDDVEERNVHKIKIHNTIAKHLSDIKEKTHKESVIDPLIIRNELICEMSKVSPPGEAVLQDLVEEIRMKNEVNDFFQELSFPKEDEEATVLRNEMREQLANKLFDLEKNGHNIANESNMKKEINKCLTKLGKQVDTEVIDTFVKKLRRTEVSRKATPLVPSISKDILPTSRNLHHSLPTRHPSLAEANKVLTPKPTVSFQPSYPPHRDPRRISKNEITSRSRIIPNPREVVIKNANIHIPTNIQVLNPVINSSINQNAPGNSNIIQQSVPSGVPVEVLNPEFQQSSPVRQVVISQQIRSPIPAAVQPPNNNMVPGPSIKLTQPAPSIAPIQEHPNSTPSAPISAPSTILPTRPIADPSVRGTRPTQAPQRHIPSTKRRDPESELPDEIDKGCKCNLRNRIRKRKRVCMRGRDFCDDFDRHIPPPLMWCDMGQPFIVFY